jgi:hypothetical protein
VIPFRTLTLYDRDGIVKPTMRRLLFTTMIVLLSAIALHAKSGGEQNGWPFSIGLDAGAVGRIAWTQTRDTPLLSQLGYGGDFGIFCRLGPVVPLRLGISWIRLRPSTISSDGQLYRGWDGTRFSAEAGYRFEFDRFGLELLAGASLTAANYLGTPLVFAYPSALAEPRLDYRIWNGFALWLGLPCELAIRGSVLTPSAGASLGIRWSESPGRSR